MLIQLRWRISLEKAGREEENKVPAVYLVPFSMKPCVCIVRRVLGPVSFRCLAWGMNFGVVLCRRRAFDRRGGG